MALRPHASGMAAPHTACYVDGLMSLIHAITLFLGGVLAASGFITAKKPEAEEFIGKLRPYQGAVGVTLLVIGVLFLLQGGLTGGFRVMRFSSLLGLTMITTVVAELVLGFILGFGLIAEWIPGEGPFEKKCFEIQAKLTAFQNPIGLVAIVASVLQLLYVVGILELQVGGFYVGGL